MSVHRIGGERHPRADNQHHPLLPVPAHSDRAPLFGGLPGVEQGDGGGGVVVVHRSTMRPVR